MQSAASMRSPSSSLPRSSYRPASRLRSSPVGVSMNGFFSRIGFAGGVRPLVLASLLAFLGAFGPELAPSLGPLFRLPAMLGFVGLKTQR